MLSLSVLVVVDGWIGRKKCLQVRGRLMHVIYLVSADIFGCSGFGPIQWKIFGIESCCLSNIRNW